jgi:hypothetical protein
MILLAVVIAFVLGLSSLVAALFLARWWTRGTDKLAWLQRLAGEVPWAPLQHRYMRAHSGDQTKMGQQPTHELYMVPRQEIAECGLKCPKCLTEVAARGDFSAVVRAFVDGQENEVIKCRGSIPLPSGRDADCPAWLVASPNTEHGDEQIEGDPPEFYRFSRITLQQAMREQYGMDVTFDLPPDGSGGLSVKAESRPSGVVPVDPTITTVLASPPGTVTEPPPSATAETALLPTITEPAKPKEP